MSGRRFVGVTDQLPEFERRVATLNSGARPSSGASSAPLERAHYDRRVP